MEAVLTEFVASGDARVDRVGADGRGQGMVEGVVKEGDIHCRRAFGANCLYDCQGAGIVQRG